MSMCSSMRTLRCNIMLLSAYVPYRCIDTVWLCLRSACCPTINLINRMQFTTTTISQLGKTLNTINCLQSSIFSHCLRWFFWNLNEPTMCFQYLLWARTSSWEIGSPCVHVVRIWSILKYNMHGRNWFNCYVMNVIASILCLDADNTI